MPDLALNVVEDTTSTPEDIDTQNMEYDHWVMVGQMMGASVVRWRGLTWCEFKLPGQSDAERVTPGMVQMLNRVLMTAANKAKKKPSECIHYDDLMAMLIGPATGDGE